jgi:hypothetical protein
MVGSKHTPAYRFTLKDFNELISNREPENIINNEDENNFNILTGHLYCDECSLFLHAGIEHGNVNYTHCLSTEDYWFESGVVNTFGHLLSHATHKETGRNVSMQFFGCVLPKNHFMKPDFAIRQTTNQIVSVFIQVNHFVTACFDVHTLKCTLYDGYHCMYNKPGKWKEYICVVLKNCKLVDPESKVVMKRPKSKNVQIIDFVGPTETIQWKVTVDYKFVKQKNDNDCGPLACLKMVELFEGKDLLKTMDNELYRFEVLQKLQNMKDTYKEEIMIPNEMFENSHNTKYT